MMMIINNNMPRYFRDLKVGAVFRYQDNFYMKIETAGGKTQAVNLHTGKVQSQCSDWVDVIPATSAQLTIN